MQALEGRPRFSVIKEPKQDARLKDFTCGTAEKWERDVNEMVEKQYLGTAIRHPTMVAMESVSGDLLGVCGFCPRPVDIPVPGPLQSEPAYIHVIGLSAGYRGWRLEDKKTRLGAALLANTLKKIAVAWSGNEMPAVWALVAPANKDSNNMFESQGFALI